VVVFGSAGSAFKWGENEDKTKFIVRNEEFKMAFIDKSLFQESLDANRIIDSIDFTQENNKNFLTVTFKNKLHNKEKLIIPFNEAIFLERFEDGLKITSYSKDLFTEYSGAHKKYALQEELKKFKQTAEKKSANLVYFLGPEKNIFIIDRSPSAPVKREVIQQDFIIRKIENPKGTLVNAVVDYNENKKEYTVSLKDIPVGTIYNDLDTIVTTEKEEKIKISFETNFEPINEIKSNQKELKPKEQVKILFADLSDDKIYIIRFNLLGMSVNAIKEGKEQEYNYQIILRVLTSEKSSKLQLAPEEQKWLQGLYEFYSNKGDDNSLRKIEELEKVSRVKYTPGK